MTDTANTTAQLIEPGTSQPEGLKLVYLEQVQAAPQVRTESGWDDASLAELGNSIIAVGLLQTPLLRENPEGVGGYTIVAGHRRIEAMRRAGFRSFYAIVGKADDQTAHIMQLTENLHREQLTTKETAWALRKLSDAGKTLGEIANIVNKSKPWVCKHLALTHKDFGSYARQLFVGGVTEDVELLNSLSQAEKLADEAEQFGYEWVSMNEPKNKKWTRKAAAELVKKAKTLQAPSATDEEESEDESNDSTDDSIGSDETMYKADTEAAKRRIQEAMISLIQDLKSSNKKMDGGTALAFIIGYACGTEQAELLEGTSSALFAMLE